MDLNGKRIHFMGIGGIGVSALAELSLKCGAVVSGCDREASENTERLERLGVNILIGHDASHVTDVDLLVFTSAITADHPERAAAGDRAIRRGSFLARLMDSHRSIGICGTHGKTTTSWMTSHILIEAGLDPTVVVGGIVPGLGGNLRVGGELFVSELDESDASFLEPNLAVAAITNIESEHLHHYKTYDNVKQAFAEYASGVEADGLLVVNTGTPEAAAIYDRHNGRKLSCGAGEKNHLRAVERIWNGSAQEFRLIREDGDLGVFTLPMAGKHNIENALVALAIAFDLGVDVGAARKALFICTGVDRRMQKLGQVGRAGIYTDYAHHPTEISACIDGARMMFDKVAVIFQPHLYSRTRDYGEEFGKALSAADTVLLAPIYPAREEPLPGVDSGLIARAVNACGGDCAGVFPLDVLSGRIHEMAGDFDAIILVGAGDIWKAGHDAIG